MAIAKRIKQAFHEIPEQAELVKNSFGGGQVMVDA